MSGFVREIAARGAARAGEAGRALDCGIARPAASRGPARERPGSEPIRARRGPGDTGPLGAGLAGARREAVNFWVFLARRGSPAKAPVKAYWKGLDLLGFSRPKRDLSMGCARFSVSSFSRAFSALWICDAQ